MSIPNRRRGLVPPPPPEYDPEWENRLRLALDKVEVAGSDFDGTLSASNIWIGEPGNSGSVISTTGCRVMDTTAQGDELDSAMDPIAYDIGQGVTFSAFGLVNNDGQLATWRPDIANDVDPTAQVANGQYIHPLMFPNGAALRAGAIGPASRVMMMRHSETPSVDAAGDIDPAADPYWQVVAPLSLYGLMDVDLATVADDGQALTYDTATAKWMAPVQYGAATTDATLITARTLTVADTTSYLIEARIVARQTGGAAGAVGDTAAFVIQGTFEATGGSVTQTGATQAAYTENSVDATWAVAFSVSGLTVKIDVTGAVNKNLTWRVLAKMHKVAG